MKKPVLTSLVVFASCALAYAGPEAISSKEMKQPVVAPTECEIDWTGFYIGVHFGYGWGNADTGVNPLPSAARFEDLLPTTLDAEPDGILGGVQFGYNRQFGHFVLGAETDFSGSGIDGSARVSPILSFSPLGVSEGPGTFIRVHQDIDWFGTARLRVGFLPTCRLLLYGTGGLAYGDVNFSADTNYVNSAFPASASETKVGWTAGAGAEFALTRRWSVKVEYLYFDLGDESSTANRVPLIPPFQVRYDWETTAHTVNVGLNFRF